MISTENVKLTGFIRLMEALFADLRDRMTVKQQLIRFQILPFPYEHYSTALHHHSETISKEDYLMSTKDVRGLKEGKRTISLHKYRDHEEADAIFHTDSADCFLKALIAIDPVFGLVINIKLFKIGTKPVEATHYEWECFDGLYVSEENLRSARINDSAMTKKYMSFAQLYTDLHHLGLLLVFKHVIAEADDHIEKGSMKFVYQKEV